MSIDLLGLDVDGSDIILHVNVLDLDILGITFPTTTSVGRCTDLVTHPAFEVESVLLLMLSRGIQVDVLHINILDIVELTLVLTDRTESDPGTSIAGNILGDDH